MYRGCGNDQITEGCQEDAAYKSCYGICSATLCNKEVLQPAAPQDGAETLNPDDQETRGRIRIAVSQILIPVRGFDRLQVTCCSLIMPFS